MLQEMCVKSFFHFCWNVYWKCGSSTEMVVETKAHRSYSVSPCFLLGAGAKERFLN